jgi:hypothetical protein
MVFGATIVGSVANAADEIDVATFVMPAESVPALKSAWTRCTSCPPGELRR